MGWTAESRKKAQETRERNILDRLKRQAYAGIPDSTPPVAPDGTFPDNFADLHIGGRRIGDIPPEYRPVALTYAQTDEGMAEAAAKQKEAEGGKYWPKVSVDDAVSRRRWIGSRVDPNTGEEIPGYFEYVNQSNDPEFGKVVQQKLDQVKSGTPAEFAADPLGVLDQYKRPGFRFKLMSKNKEGGSNQMYEAVKKANGDTLRVKDMPVGIVPDEVAESRNKYYRSRGNVILEQITAKHKAEGGRLTPADQ